MDCPRCGSGKYKKNGIVKERQRYKCKQCQYNYTIQKRSGEIPEEVKQHALDMYLEGLGFRAIGRILKVSHTAVYYWVKQAGKALELPVADERIDVVEVDELHTYVNKKKLPMDLDSGRPGRQTLSIIRLWRSFDSNRSEVMGEVEGLVGGLFCDGSLAELRRVYSVGAAYSEQVGDVYGRGIQ